MMRTRSAAAGRIRDLCVRFNGHTAVDRASLDIPGNGVTVLTGRSGSGKTSLLRAINRLNEEIPGCETSGEIHLDLDEGTVAVHALPKRALPDLRRRVGMSFQAPNVLPVSIWKNLTLPLALVAGCPSCELERRARAALEATGLWEEVKDRLGARAETLSGGQQQRLCLARVLALEPAILLLDEPTAFLDPEAAERVETLLRGLAGKYTVVATSHDLDQTLRLADRCVVVADGRPTHAFDRGSPPSRRELADLVAARRP